MLLLHGFYDGKASRGSRKPEPRALQVQGRYRCLRQEAFADGAKAIQTGGEKGLRAEVVYLRQQKSRVIDIAYGIIEHSGEHYGQLVVYYRLAGLVPPESRPKQ